MATLYLDNVGGESIRIPDVCVNFMKSGITYVVPKAALYDAAVCELNRIGASTSIEEVQIKVKFILQNAEIVDSAQYIKGPCRVQVSKGDKIYKNLIY